MSVHYINIGDIESHFRFFKVEETKTLDLIISSKLRLPGEPPAIRGIHTTYHPERIQDGMQNALVHVRMPSGGKSITLMHRYLEPVKTSALIDTSWVNLTSLEWEGALPFLSRKEHEFIPRDFGPYVTTFIYLDKKRILFKELSSELNDFEHPPSTDKYPILVPQPDGKGVVTVPKGHEVEYYLVSFDLKSGAELVVLMVGASAPNGDNWITNPTELEGEFLAWGGGKMISRSVRRRKKSDGES